MTVEISEMKSRKEIVSAGSGVGVKVAFVPVSALTLSLLRATVVARARTCVGSTHLFEMIDARVRVRCNQILGLLWLVDATPIISLISP